MHIFPLLLVGNDLQIFQDRKKEIRRQIHLLKMKILELESEMIGINLFLETINKVKELYIEEDD